MNCGYFLDRAVLKVVVNFDTLESRNLGEKMKRNETQSATLKHIIINNSNKLYS